MRSVSFEKALLNWLEEKGHICFTNISISGKFPNIVSLKDKIITAFEIKNRAVDVTAAIGNCLHYLQQANVAYIVLPYEEIGFVPAETRDMLKSYGIGLMSVDLVSSSPTVKISTEPKSISKNNLSLIKKLDELNKTQENGEKPPTQNGDNIKERIIELLREHPEGLNVLIISKHLGVTRQTTAKYMYGLISEGIVKIRKVGPAKLCYLKRWGRKSDKR